MATTIKLKNGSGAPLAGDLVAGEPALDLTNKRLYTEDSGGTVIEVGTNPTSVTTGTFTSTGIDDNAASTAITIDGSQNVGIGASPSYNFHVTGTGDTIAAVTAGASSIAGLNLGNDTNKADGGIRYDNSADALIFRASNAEKMRIDASGNLLVGNTVTDPATSNVNGVAITAGGEVIASLNGVAAQFNRRISDGDVAVFKKGGDTKGSIGILSSRLYIGSGDTGIKFSGADDLISPIDASDGTGRDAAIDLGSSGARFKDLYLSGNVQMGGNLDVVGQISSYDNVGASYGTMNFRAADFVYKNAGGTERMRIDSSGNLLVGTTSTSASVAGGRIFSTGRLVTSVNSEGHYFRRNTTDGTIVEFAKDSSTVGSIGTSTGSYPYIAGGSSGGTHAGIRFINDQSIRPCTSTGDNLDNTLDLGAGTARWDDIYATNGTIQTSDRNEKQDIEALSDAEQRVAVAAKGLLRKFRWIDSVEAKGDDARIHFGIIAQDLQDAFTAEGLDAGRYAMFISTTWWESTEVIPAVEAQEAVVDEEGNVIEEAVEAQEERAVVHTHNTAEEAPEGSVERTRLGVRYPQLLAFIIAAI